MVTEAHSWYFAGPTKQKPGTYDVYRVIHCTNEVSDWIKTQDSKEWLHIPVDRAYESSYWVSDRLILLLNLCWPVTYQSDF